MIFKEWLRSVGIKGNPSLNLIECWDYQEKRSNENLRMEKFKQLALREHIKTLKSDIQQLEKDNDRLVKKLKRKSLDNGN